MFATYLMPVCFLVCLPSMLQATLISFSSSVQNATLGETVSLDRNISGLNDSGLDPLGTYDLDILVYKGTISRPDPGSALIKSAIRMFKP